MIYQKKRQYTKKLVQNPKVKVRTGKFTFSKKQQLKELIARPNKLKAYAVLRSQKRHDLRAYFSPNIVFELDTNKIDVKLKKLFFGSSYIAGQYDNKGYEIIVPKKFKTESKPVNKTNVTDQQPVKKVGFYQSNKISFDDLIKSKYALYKNNFKKSTGAQKHEIHQPQHQSDIWGKNDIFSICSDDEDSRVTIDLEESESTEKNFIGLHSASKYSGKKLKSTYHSETKSLVFSDYSNLSITKNGLCSLKSSYIFSNDFGRF